MARQTKSQKDTIERVMHEFKEGELAQKGGRKIKDRKQAVAVALHEAGASKNETPADNRKNQRKTEAKEAAGKTATAKRGTAATGRRKASGASRAKADTKPAAGSGASKSGASKGKTAAARKTSSARKAAEQKTAARRAKPRQAKKAMGGGKTRADLYREATRRGIAGRSRMSKQELERALAR